MDQPAWETTPAGIVIPVQAQPKSRRNAVLGVRDGRLLVAVTQPPENGKANESLVKVLAEALGIKRRQVALIAGAASSRKRFLVVDAELSDLQDRVARLPD